MQAEVIAIGTELLLGATVDTNSAYLAQQLAGIGVPLRRVTLVRDEMREIVAAIREALGRVELVICSGGLGPTDDDLTREAIATALDRSLEFHQTLLDDIAARFVAYKRPMSPSNRRQAFVPGDAFIIRNPRGTAPSFVAERDGGLVAALPGVPAELMYLTEHGLIPYLRDEHGVTDVIVVREVRVSGLPESVAGERIADMMNRDNPVVGITAKRGQHTIRIAATASSQAEAEALIAPLVRRLEARFVGHLLGDETLEQHVMRTMEERGLALLLREGLPEAPVFGLLSPIPAGRSVLGRGTVNIQTWPAGTRPSRKTLEHEAIRMLAAAEAPGVALLVIPFPQEPGAEYRNVACLASDGRRQEYAERGFDLNIAVGFDLVAAHAVETLRRLLD